MKKKAVDKIKNKKQLMTELYRYIHTEGYHDFKLPMLGLAYLINEMVPDDRTTKHVFKLVEKEGNI